MQTRVKRRCLGCVLYSLMHRYARPAYRGSASDASADLPGARASLQGLLLPLAPNKQTNNIDKLISLKSLPLTPN